MINQIENQSGLSTRRRCGCSTTRPGPPSPAPPSPGSYRGRPSGEVTRRSAGGQEVTHLPSSTEGQLYRALVVWAEHWIQEGRYTSLQEAIAEFIPR